MKKVFFLILIMWGSATAFSQTLTIEFAEILLSSSKTKILDTLKSEGFENLTDSEIFKEAFLVNSNVSLAETNKKLYTIKKVRKVYELRKAFGGGICQVTLSMKEPTCNKISTIRWNSNLQWSARKYAMEFQNLGYIKNSQGDYINYEKAITVILYIDKQYNELVLVMTKDL